MAPLMLFKKTSSNTGPTKFKFDKSNLAPIDPQKNQLLNLEVSAEFEESQKSPGVSENSVSNEYG